MQLDIFVSIPKRVSEVLKRCSATRTGERLFKVSIPKRVSEVLKLKRPNHSY